MERDGGEDDDIVCLDESFFINDNYQLTRFTFGSQVLELYCLQSASMHECFTPRVVSISFLSGLSTSSLPYFNGIDTEKKKVKDALTLFKLSAVQYSFAVQHSRKAPPDQPSSKMQIHIRLRIQSKSCSEPVNIFKNHAFVPCRMDDMVINEASQHGLHVTEVAGTRATIRNLEGVIYEITSG
ncbi:UNVERIFIED_CONTAM: hypothetical protein Sangu_0348700 [Sesamum angustifolium]|uniref:Uncharacterized protein n=1 Tax=Sesamum angustifolium TaxID=2727405 RepID=A0AAW2QR81_9LAMI